MITIKPTSVVYRLDFSREEVTNDQVTEALVRIRRLDFVRSAYRLTKREVDHIARQDALAIETKEDPAEEAVMALILAAWEGKTR